MTARDRDQLLPRFTSRDIRNLFVEILRREQPPTDAACAEVGRVLHNMRLSFEFNRNPPPEAAQARRCRDEVFASTEKAFAPMRAALKAVEAATPELEKALAKIQMYVPTNDDLDRKFAESTATTARQMLLELGQVGEALSGYLAPLLPPKTDANDLWFEYAQTMLWLFARAMRTSIKDKTEWAVSRDSPATRFIQKGIFLVMGLHVELATIKSRFLRADKS